VASVNINDELRRFAEREAARRGYAGASEYVERLIARARAEQSDAGAAQDSASVNQVLAELDGLRVGNRLDGLSIRELIVEGRRL
jgi:hypothetical protein